MKNSIFHFLKINGNQMSSDSIRVFAPASVSNVGPGFDLMGFALRAPGDEIILRKRKKSGVKITKISGDGGRLPKEAELNTASTAAISLLKKYHIETGIGIEIRKKMGIGSGLGSSAASAVGAVFALNKLLDLKLTKNELLPHAVAGEFAASGDIHADNTAPSLFGGFTLIKGYDPIDIIKLPTPKNLYCTIIYPQIEIKTAEARKILPKSVTLRKLVAHTGSASGLIAGLLMNDISLIRRSLIDEIIEPVRAKLIPDYNLIKKSAIQAGAINCNISGSGPSLFSFSTDKNTAENIASEAGGVVRSRNIKCFTSVGKINKTGPRILD